MQILRMDRTYSYCIYILVFLLPALWLGQAIEPLYTSVCSTVKWEMIVISIYWISLSDTIQVRCTQYIKIHVSYYYLQEGPYILGAVGRTQHLSKLQPEKQHIRNQCLGRIFQSLTTRLNQKQPWEPSPQILPSVPPQHPASTTASSKDIRLLMNIQQTPSWSSWSSRSAGDTHPQSTQLSLPRRIQTGNKTK